MTVDAVGGVFSYALELARQLCGQGHRLLLASMGPRPTRAQRAELCAIAGVELYESDYALEWMSEPWQDVDAAGSWLLGLEQRFAPDVVHVNGYSHGALPWVAPSVVVGHSCMSSWWQAVRGEALPVEHSVYWRRVREGLVRAAAVVAPTQAMLAALSEHYGALPNARVIYNGVDALQFVPAAKAPLFMAAGRFEDAAKNLELLRRAAPALPWPVRIAGASTACLEPGENLAFLGVLSRAELALELSRTSVFLHPARYEPFGLAPLEAALSGCALVLADVASLREVWQDAALYASPNDVAALVDCASRLAGDGALRERLAQRARERASWFSSARSAAAYLALYRELVVRARSTSAGPARSFSLLSGDSSAAPRTASHTQESAR
jgi:glycosyltransferase involved in cell wall biosynthesis